MPIFIIDDYQGAGPLRFGMARQAIESVMGSPARSSTRGGGLRLSWDSGVTTKLEVAPGSSELTLCEIGFSRHASMVTWRGIEVFRDLKRFATEAVRQDSAPLTGFGFLVLRDFGLAISGVNGPVEDQAITVFCRGRWDSHLDGMIPFSRF